MSKKIKGYDGILATRLRGLMDEAKITQIELAKKLGITRQSISQYMDGSIVPNAEKLYLIADFFDVSSDYLLGRTNVRTLSTDIVTACKITGLSEEFVKCLNTSHPNKLEIMNIMFKNNFIQNMVKSIEYEVTILILEQIRTSEMENFAITRSLDGKISANVELEHKDLDKYFEYEMQEIKRKVIDCCNQNMGKFLNDIFNSWKEKTIESMDGEVLDRIIKKSCLEYYIHDKMLWYGSRIAQICAKSNNKPKSEN